MPDPESIKECWNALAKDHGLTPVRTVSLSRRKKIAARLKEIPDLWEQLGAALATRGAWARDHRFPTFRQVCQEETLLGLLEGNYSGGDNGTGRLSTDEAVRVAMEAQRAKEGR